MPIVLFTKINATQDLSLLGYHLKPFGVWQSINDEIISKFGLSDEYRAYLDAQKRWLQANIDNIENPNTLNAALISLREGEVNSFFSTKRADGIEKNIAELEKIKGFKLKFNKLTVMEYFTYINDLKDGRKKD